MFFSFRPRECDAKPRTGRRASAGLRPRLEVLEGRDVPSTLKVTSLADSGPGTLRNEIAQAQSGDTIIFDKHLQTITLTGGELLINKNLTIQGPGAGRLTVESNYLVDAYHSRIFDVGPLGRVTLSGLTISHGDGVASMYGDPYDGNGGAVLNRGTLTMSGCTLSNNEGYLGGGAVYNLGTLTVSGCTVSGNFTQEGGGIGNVGTMTVIGGMVSNNSAYSFGGGIFNSGTATVSGCTLSGNLAYSSGGGIYNAGPAAALTVSNSTFSGNSPDNIVGLYTDGGGNTFS